MQNKTLFVFSSSRNVRDFYFGELNSNSLLPKAINVAEFFQEALYVPNSRRASQTECLLHMRNAANKVENISAILNIKSEFLLFLKNSNYLFSFFKELSNSKRTISDLSMADTYSSYDEHLAILDNLGRIYKENLKELGLYDDITIGDCYEINSNFISNFDRIEFRIDGVVSALEWEILSKISDKIELIIDLDCSKFNQKVVNDIRDFTNLNLEIGYNYKINLSNKTIKEKIELKPEPNIHLKGFSIRSLQAAFVFDEISKMARAGIDPQKIAVILPDESFAYILQNLDENNMLNYAMGKSLKNSPIYTILHSLKEAITQGLEYEFNENYINEAKRPNQIISTLNSFGLPTKVYTDIQNAFYFQSSFEKFESLMQPILSSAKTNLEISQIILSELFNIKNLLSGVELKFSEILELFLLNFANQKESIVGGGVVTVMGILESRYMSYDGVIIVDFNDSFVPKRSQKEMFLSSVVRKNAGLISHNDRENLQRFYYESLIKRAKMVSISYVENDENMLSRFIKDFKNIIQIPSPQISYENALYHGGVAIDIKFKEIIKEHDFFCYPLSFSRLNSYLKCPRQYYYKYIQKIDESRFNSKEALELGSAIHEALQKYFEKSPYKFKKDEFLKLYNSYENPKPTLKNELFKIRLDKFETTQNSHFKDGFSVKDCELDIKAQFGGVWLNGKIDRVDISGDEIWLIDYKSGSLDSDSLQLAFYQALYLAKYNKETKSYFYSLAQNKFESSKKSIEDLNLVLDKLKSISKTQIRFTQNTKNCQYCPYTTLCLRGLK